MSEQQSRDPLSGFVIVDADGVPVGVDSSSGGYPFRALYPAQVAWFYSAQLAEVYRKHGESAGGVACPAPWRVVAASITLVEPRRV